MTLLRCHVDNFGGLSDFDYEFSGGLTILHEANGFGKSTLAAFLKAMFYGLPAKGGREAANNARKKYLPWQGGAFGGSLDFSLDGVEYRVSRSFGKTAAGDEFALYDLTNRCASDRFSPALGEELFGLNADSYARSTYLPQEPFDGSFSTDSIRAKLTNLVDATDDINNYQSAYDRLRARRSDYKPYRGSGGETGKLSRSADKNDQELRLLQGEAEALPALEAQLDTLQRTEAEQAEAAKTAQARRRAAEAAALLREKRVCEARIKESRDALDTLAREFPAGLPSRAEWQERRDAWKAANDAPPPAPLDPEDAARYEQGKALFSDNRAVEADIERCLELLGQWDDAQDGLRALQLTEDEARRARALSHRFSGGVPSEQELDRCEDDLRTLNEKAGALRQAALPPDARRRLQELQRFFASGVPDEAFLQELEEKRRTRDRLRADAQDDAPPQAAPGRTKAELALAVVGGVLLAAGAVCLFLARTLPGAALCAAGAALLLAALVLNRAEHSRRAAQQRQEAERRRRLTADAQAAQTALDDAFARYYPGRPPQDAMLADLRARADEFEDLSRQSAKARRDADALRLEIDALRGGVRAFLRLPQEGGEDEADALRDLRAARDEYQRLYEKSRRAKADGAPLRAQQAQAADALEHILQAYGAWRPDAPRAYADALEALRRRYRDYRPAAARAEARADALRAQERRRSEQQEACRAFFARWRLAGGPDAAFARADEAIRQKEDAERRLSEESERLQKLASDLPDVPVPEEFLSGTGIPDAEALRRAEDDAQAALERTRSTLRDRRAERDGLRRRADRLPDLQDEARRLSDDLAAAEHRAALLDAAQTLLTEARDSLTNAYVGRVEERFLSYVNDLLGGAPGRVSLDKDLNLCIEKDGGRREVELFSAGLRDCLRLCLRLALVDVMFEDEQPCVVLDDPFVNLDEAHTAHALQILEKIAQTRQIVYLVCNASRLP